MIVVSDTSPLNYLILIKAIDVLPRLFGEVYVPPKVVEELQRPKTPAPVKRWIESLPAWLKVITPATPFVANARLDPGEAQAIALAKELHAAAILIDERKGRRVAKEEGFRAVGTITVLELAAQQNLLELEPMLEELQLTTFRISTAQVQAVLAAEVVRKTAAKRDA